MRKDGSVDATGTIEQRVCLPFDNLQRAVARACKTMTTWHRC